MTMRKILVFLLITFSLTALAQKTREQMGGVYYAYPLSVTDTITYSSVPVGYHPFYISCYARHGSRWLPDEHRYLWVNKCFSENSNLTGLGKKLKRQLKKIWKNARGNGGQLTALGVIQQRELARRLVARYPSLFCSPIEVQSRSSVVNRCRKSMFAFTRELQHLLPAHSGDWNICTDSADMRWIAYSSPEEEKLIARTHPVMQGSSSRFISSLFKKTALVPDSVKLMSEIYTIASDMQDIPMKISLYDFFTDKELHSLYEQNNRRMWICNGLAPDNYGIPRLSAVSLWKHIEQQADSVIAVRGQAASFCFGHDTSLYRLMALLGLSSLHEETVDAADEVVPMAANLTMVFYTDGGHVLVKFLHNEKEVKLSGLSRQSCYYPWKLVKDYVNKRIEKARMLRLLKNINTMVGTDDAVTHSLSVYGNGSEEHGQTLPAVLEPNGMTFWTPQTEDTEQKCLAPYYYKDKRLQGFRGSHWLVGGCTQDYGSFTIMPELDRLRLKAEEREVPFSHDQEISHPDYYAVKMPSEHLTAEMTGLSHSAFFRFTYTQSGMAYLVVNPNSDEREGFVAVDTVHNCIYGYNPVHRIYQGWGEKAGFSGWFVVTFNQPVVGYGVKDTVAWVAFNVEKGEQVLVKTACSFVDLKGAVNNLMQEMPDWDFYRARQHSANSWLGKLKQIEVYDSNEPLVNKFYGALYRASFLPRTFSDADGRYPSFSGGQILQCSRDSLPDEHAGHRFFMDYSLWDTYRALNPLNILIEPKEGAMMQSLVEMYRQGGWLPIFPCWNSYTAAMIGDHATASLADAIIKGVEGIDVKTAYEAMRKNAFQSPSSKKEYENGMGRRALKSYLKYGYIPLEDSVKEAFHTREQVSRTLEYAFDDFCLARVARKLGKTKDYRLLMKRALNYRNVINPKTGWADGRYANGRWLNNKDIRSRVPFITEGAVSHYTWYVPQDPYGLMKIMGGKKKYLAKLDRMFTDSLYWHGNEPCHQIPYMYAYAGEPWKTQTLVHKILQTEYEDVPGGLSGNDDAGQMSAWYLFSSLGFYPVCPGSVYYILGSPGFRKVDIHTVHGRVFSVIAQNVSEDNIFIQSATLNGLPYTKNYITQDELCKGGVLEFKMGNKPNKQWGSNLDDCPPDLMK